MLTYNRHHSTAQMLNGSGDSDNLRQGTTQVSDIFHIEALALLTAKLFIGHGGNFNHIEFIKQNYAKVPGA